MQRGRDRPDGCVVTCVDSMGRDEIRGAWLKEAVLAAAALAVRLYGLGRQSLWSDELVRLTWAKGYEFDHVFGVVASETGVRLAPSSLERALTVVSRHNPPLYGALLNLWLRIAGNGTDFVARLPSAILSAACAPIMYAALRRRFGEPAAVATGALVALSPYHLVYAQEVNHYALASACVAASFYFFIRHAERPTLGAGTGWALTSAAALYAHYYAAIVVFFQCLSALVCARRRRASVTRALWPGAVAAILFVPYLPLLRAQLPELTSAAQLGAFQGTAYFLDRLRAMLVMPLTGELGNYSPWLEATPVIVVSAALCTLGIVRARRLDRVLLLLNTLGPILVVGVAFFVLRENSILWPRYQLFFSFAWYACMGVALGAMSGSWRWASVLVVSVLLVAGVVHDDRIVREDWRTAAALVDGSGAGEPVLVYRQNLVYSLARYLRGKSRLFGIGPTEQLEQTLGIIIDSADAVRGVWYASAWAESNEMANRVHSFLAKHYAHCNAASVNPGVVDMRLTHCVRRLSTMDAPPPWWLPREGPTREGGWVESRAPSGVGGWAFSSRGVRAIRVILDGKTIAEIPHPGSGRPDVAHVFHDYPRDLTEPSGFFVPVRLSGPAIQRTKVAAVRADGSSFYLPSSADQARSGDSAGG